MQPETLMDGRRRRCNILLAINLIIASKTIHIEMELKEEYRKDKQPLIDTEDIINLVCGK